MRAPQSPRTALILLLLLRSSLAASELARALGIETRQVYPYLRILERHGLVRREGFEWLLTETGEEYVKRHQRYLEGLLGNREALNEAKRGLTRLNEAKRILDFIKANFDVDGCEELVEFLVMYRLKTGRAYWQAPQSDLAFALAEVLRSSGYTSARVGECLRHLESEGVIWVTIDSRRRLPKVRINRALDPLFGRKVY